MQAAQYNKNLPEFLHRTQEQLDAEAERQATAAAGTGFNYDEDVVLYNRALKDIELSQGETDEFNLTRMAEACLELGKFAEAAEIHPDARYKEFLTRLKDAPDHKPCSHPDTRNYAERRGNERVPVALPNFRLWRMVYNGSPHKYISIFVCNECRALWKEEN